MARKLFGTDGIRGTANIHPVTAEVAMRLGMAAGTYFNRGDHRHRVVIAKDTRLSGYLLEPALTAGFIAVGVDVILVGPMPTPAVAMLVKSLRADLGVMISASHNPYEDNGIKLFAPDGYKLSDEAEAAIEAEMLKDKPSFRAPSKGLGRAKRLEDATGRYIEYVKRTFPKGQRLDGMKIVIDCANGAAYRIAPPVLWELGAEVIAIGVSPNGTNINKNCGSTSPKALQEKVREVKADIGIALDGDADRLVLCDEKGKLIDGDQIMAMVATYAHERGLLRGGGVVATQMSNMGLERYLHTLGLVLFRTKVGDRYVVEEMKKRGRNVGGEQSGHIILSDYSTTGDGLVAALQSLALIRASGKPASKSSRRFTPLPQLLENVRYSGSSPLGVASVKNAIRDAEEFLAGKGRIFIRKSGTEPLIRVMAEGDDRKRVAAAVDGVVAAIEKAVAARG
ncbi:MAG: phosphoglucosamine mutase [Alphaproteobacteria bacterium]|nr:phosphoglucosamine mutase [Alphaproteobacteria bacterium]